MLEKKKPPLAAQAYEYCVNNFTLDTELDVVIAVNRMMPQFIDRPCVGGRRTYVVANETTIGENFAERWNTEPARSVAFYAWHGKVLSDFEKLPGIEGMDLITEDLAARYGSGVGRPRHRCAQGRDLEGARCTEALRRSRHWAFADEQLGRYAGPEKHVFRREMTNSHRPDLTPAQQFIFLRTNPVCRGARRIGTEVSRELIGHLRGVKLTASAPCAMCRNSTRLRTQGHSR